jgi:hypothetical protein
MLPRIVMALLNTTGHVPVFDNVYDVDIEPFTTTWTHVPLMGLFHSTPGKPRVVAFVSHASPAGVSESAVSAMLFVFDWLVFGRFEQLSPETTPSPSGSVANCWRTAEACSRSRARCPNYRPS